MLMLIKLYYCVLKVTMVLWWKHGYRGTFLLAIAESKTSG